MKKIYIYALVLLSSTSLIIQSCTKDLDLYPKYGLNSAVVYEDPENYIHVLAKLYAGLVLTGLQGPAGNSDVAASDEGFYGYLRVFWNLQELPTDEIKCAWGDGGISELNQMSWSATNPFVKAMYSRLFFQITMSNEFIRECSEDNMERRGFSDEFKKQIRNYQSEARFLRAYSWVHAIDLFGGNVPFMTEENGIGAFEAEQTNPKDLFEYAESELLAIESSLVNARSNEYGRADKAAAWFLLAHMYLNAETWIGENRYEDCVTYCNKIISAGYTLESKYINNFLADNQNSTEAIFSSNCDAEQSQSYGGTSFLVFSTVGGTMDINDFGINPKNGWAGNRTTYSFAQNFLGDAKDGDRFLFYTSEDDTAISDSIHTIGSFTNGWALTKYRNMVHSGDTFVQAKFNASSDQVDNDFHWMRLGEVYLMYAECAVRGAGSMSLGINYVNELRTRANEPLIASMDLDFILAERGRELQFEGKRRTDLIRFGKFVSSDFLWEYKGGSPLGSGVSDIYNIYPLSADDVIANPNLTQNPGY